MSSEIAEFDLSKQFNNRFLSLEEDETEGIECDCEFIIGPQNAVVKGHKFLFSAASKVFRDIFYGNIKTNEAVRIHELDLDAFQGMKQFIYTGYVDFKSSIHALYTYTAALKYVIPALSSACIAFIEKNGIPPCEVLEFYEHCKIQNILEFDELCSSCFEVIQNETHRVVLGSEYFLSACQETIEFILKSPALSLASELEVFNFFEKWALAEAKRKGIKDVESSFNNLKKHIRFLTLSYDEYVSSVEKSPLLTKDEKYAIALNLMVFNSKPMPEYLSSDRKRRTLTYSLNRQFEFDFEVDLHELKFISSEYLIPHDLFGHNGAMAIICTEISGNICFQILRKPCIMDKRLDYKDLMKFEAFFEVVAKQEFDNLYFKSEAHLILDLSVCEVEQNKTILARIPVSKLENGHFFRGENSKVNIKVLLNISSEQD